MFTKVKGRKRKPVKHFIGRANGLATSSMLTYCGGQSENCTWRVAVLKYTHASVFVSAESESKSMQFDR